MTYTPEQIEEFFAKKVFNSLEGAQREDVVDAAMKGIAKGVFDFRIKYNSLSPEMMERMINAYDTEEEFLERKRLVKFKCHPSTGKGSIVLDAEKVVLREKKSGTVLVDFLTDRAYRIAENLEEAQKAVEIALAQKRSKMTEWIPIEDVLNVIEKSKDKKSADWTWVMNSKCKYISLRIDMRDGHCLILDRHDNPITLEQLQYQYNGGLK